MALVKIQKKFAINIPSSVRDELIKEGSYLELSKLEDGGFKAIPVKIVPERLNAKEQKAVEQARKDLLIGNDSSGPFSTADELIEHLHKSVGNDA